MFCLENDESYLIIHKSNRYKYSKLLYLKFECEQQDNNHETFNVSRIPQMFVHSFEMMDCIKIHYIIAGVIKMYMLFS